MNENIRQATVDDVEIIRQFLSEHWSQNHILTKSEELFNFFYFNRFKKNLNFFLGFQNNQLTGIQGFIPSNQFVSEVTPPLNSENNLVICLSLWKVLSFAPNGQGLRLIRRIEDTFLNSTIIATGYHDSVEPIYKRLGYDTGVLNHYTVMHPNLKNVDTIFESLPDVKSNIVVGLQNVDLIKLKNSERINEYLINLGKNNKIKNFVKPPEHYLKRFIDFKWYNYEFYQIVSKKRENLGFFISRITASPYGPVLRIVDIITDDYSLNLYDPIQELLIDLNLIYADYFDNLNIEKNQVPFGLIRLNETQNLPNLFEPFSNRRKLIRLAIRTKTNCALPYITRSDGDQDRPSEVR